MEKFRGIPFMVLPRKEQNRLANQLDQTDCTGKDYIVFAQTLEKMCAYQLGVVEFHALRVMQTKTIGPTLTLFDHYYVHNPKITLDLVYRVLQEMGLDDCTAVLDEAYEDIKKRHESGRCQPFNEDRQLNVHRCTCESCRPLHSVEQEDIPSNNTNPRCHPPCTTCSSSQRTCHPSWTNCERSNINCIHPNISSVHSRLLPTESAGHPYAPPQVTPYLQQNNHFVRQNEHLMQRQDRFSQDGPNWVPRGHPISHDGHNIMRHVPQNVVVPPCPPCPPHPPAHYSTSTVQLPYYQGSSLKTPVTHVSTQPGPETGAIPKQPSQRVDESEGSSLSPLTSQSYVDNRQCLPRNLYQQFYPSPGRKEPPTQANDSDNYCRLLPEVNDLGKDNVMRPVRTNQCTCPPYVRPQYTPSIPAGEYQNRSQISFIPPSDSEEDDSDETKLLEVVESSSCNRSQLTFQSPTKNGPSSTRQSSNKADAERRYSDPPDNFPPSSPFDNGVRRSISDDELKCSLSPAEPVYLHKVQNPIKLFLTFADDSEEHLEEVLDLGKLLKEMGYSVKCDMFDQTIQKLISDPGSREVQQSMQQFFSNSHDWLDDQILNASYLVFCISPKYFQYVRPQEEIYGNSTAHSVGSARSLTEMAQPNSCHLHTKYIYNQACSEHLQKLTQNKRFFPVLFQKSGATQHHIPNIFKSTWIFNYPDPKKSLLTYLSNQFKERTMQ
ncbi:uncharacterized protein LOC117336072 [Pecten maximus]|uniref:uncharacterized protein LOC117336072 n=1 Tax=Pecten maximus TaxID=6579 RepID=UPI0014588D6C|nr:uncharacterized protein LOC117336072 [Pecten maximus]XP_033752329.1 uncharacterized protein LOC117336072 [Pecten maximus]